MSSGGGPHAVTQVGTTAYFYDPVGNRIRKDATVNADDETQSYDALNQLTFATRGDISSSQFPFDVEFAYAPDLARYRRIDRQNGSVVRTTRTIGNVEVVISGGMTETRRYLTGGAIVSTCTNSSGQAVACSGGALVQDRYALSDHLGSVDVVVNDAGVVVESTSFDAYGARRSAADWRSAGTALATTTRGFTGHEHIDAFNLVHMNGRIYDPALGRFLQADPMIDAGTQGLNRYSYVLNNPLTLTDPTGHLSTHEWGQVFMTAVLALGTGGFGAATAPMTTTQTYVFAGANGFMAGAVQSQSLKGGAWGAFSAVAFHAVGSYFDSAEWAHNGRHVFGTDLDAGGYAAKVLAHGTLGGAVQHLQGGKFGSGFAAAGITQAFSGGIDAIDPANPGLGATLRVVAAGMVGGAISDLTGDKFASGFVTAAFARAFNHELSATAEYDAEVAKYRDNMSYRLRLGRGVAQDAMAGGEVALEEGWWAIFLGAMGRVAGGGRMTVAEARAVGLEREAFLASVYGGGKVSLPTSRGWRHIDNFADGVAMESKIGRTALTRRVFSQVMKDRELLYSGSSGVRSVEWHFFAGRTGTGPTAPLRGLLEDSGIKVVVH